MRVALICPTIGQTRRGYERYFSDLFRFTRDQIDITLFKGGGDAGPRERVIPHLTRTGALSHLFQDRFRYIRYRLEFASFAVSICPALLRGGYDIAHFIDPPLGPHFARLRDYARLPLRLLFSNAGPMSHDGSRWADHIHCLSPLAWQEAQDLGITPGRLTLLPMGVDPTALAPHADAAELRRKYEVLPGQFVVLAIASLNRHHKRLDYLIEEVAQLSGEPLLWVDGSLHPDGDPSLLALGRQLLGARFRHTHLPSARVADLFGLADVLVSAATQESFGMAISEAMAVGVPVVAHDSEHFRWLVGARGHLTDMSVPHGLASLLSELMRDPSRLRERVDPAAVLVRFGWPSVAAGHLEMYRRVMAG